MGQNAEKQIKPNILWLTYEDTSPQFIGCYGDENAKTPTIDALANDGVRFTSAFSNGTVSSPSRSCLITGCRTTTLGTGNHRSAYPIPEFVKGFPTYLREAGYYTSNNSKTDYNTSNEKAIIKSSWNESSNKAGWWNRKPGQPFFAVFNSFHSHQSRTMTNPWENYEKNILADLDSNRMTPMYGNFEMPSFYRDSPAMRKYFSRVYNSISRTDQEFAEILARLEKDGLKDSTIVFCFSDHGEGIPRGKGSALGLGFRVPFIVWIPEMYKHLSPVGSGIVTEQLVSFEDFGPTVLALAGVEIPKYMEGKPILGTKKTEAKKYVYGACDALDNNWELSRSVSDGKYMYTRVFTPFQPWVRWTSYYDVSDIQKQMRKDFASGLMNAEQANIMIPRTNEYLYDLENDKWETNNLAENTDFKKVLVKFRKELKKHIVKNNDANFIPEYTLSELKNKTLPYDLRSNKKVYPISKVINAALLCGMGSEVIDEQISLLASQNELVTFWAAVGLFSQRESLSPHSNDLTSLLEKLSYQPARIFLSGALLNSSNNTEATKIINEGLLNSNVFINLLSMQILLNIDLEKAKIFLPVVHQSIKKYKGVKGRDNVNDYMNVVLLRLENKSYTFSHFW